MYVLSLNKTKVQNKSLECDQLHNEMKAQEFLKGELKNQEAGNTELSHEVETLKAYVAKSEFRVESLEAQMSEARNEKNRLSEQFVADHKHWAERVQRC